jgi:hypothetical protein
MSGVSETGPVDGFSAERAEPNEARREVGESLTRRLLGSRWRPQMVDEPENHTIRLLTEMREELRAGFANVNLRIDGLTHILTLLAGRSHDHEDRIERSHQSRMSKGDTQYQPSPRFRNGSIFRTGAYLTVEILSVKRIMHPKLLPINR